jgi:hypothetical protein
MKTAEEIERVHINQSVLPRTRNFLLLLKNSLGKKTIGEAIDVVVEKRNSKETTI